MNALELLDIAMSVYMLVVVFGELPVGGKGCVLLRGNNETTIHWVRRCRGGN